jgi:hypothetical protein
MRSQWLRYVLVAIIAVASGYLLFTWAYPPPPTTARYLGVYEPGTPSSYQQVTEFSAATGERPNLLLYYSRWGSGFPGSFAREALAHGAELIVQINPTDISLAKIASGRYDAYLHSYAEQLRAFGHPVVIGWGAGHVPAATWVAAWRHVVTTIRSAGAHQVTWLWTISRNGPARVYWPGGSYVSWVGIDGYFEQPSDTYASVFGSAVAAVRSYTSKPILLSEVGVGPGTGHKPQDITAVFNGIRAQHLLGSVWFDVDQQGSPPHQDWRLEGDQAALAAFRRGASGMKLIRTAG